MLNRRGITLIELMVGIVLMGIIGVSLVKVSTSLMGASGAQVRMAASQGEARIGTLMLPQEFREIGYDTAIVSAGTNYATTDLIAIAGDQLSFLASRGMGIQRWSAQRIRHRAGRRPLLEITPCPHGA